MTDLENNLNKKDAQLIFKAGSMLSNLCNVDFDYTDEYTAEINQMLTYAYPEDEIRDCCSALIRNELSDDADYLFDVYNNLRAVVGKEILKL